MSNRLKTAIGAFVFFFLFFLGNGLIESQFEIDAGFLKTLLASFAGASVSALLSYFFINTERANKIWGKKHYWFRCISLTIKTKLLSYGILL